MHICAMLLTSHNSMRPVIMIPSKHLALINGLSLTNLIKFYQMKLLMKLKIIPTRMLLDSFSKQIRLYKQILLIHIRKLSQKLQITLCQNLLCMLITSIPITTVPILILLFSTVMYQILLYQHIMVMEVFGHLSLLCLQFGYI